jgi:hypothetical protein
VFNKALQLGKKQADLGQYIEADYYSQTNILKALRYYIPLGYYY